MQTHKHFLRIIAGKWRGRKIHFNKNNTIRPTTDQTKETLFNWLAPTIVNSNCLDLFAGSGALSFEALSRGADTATAIEQNHQNIEQLQKTANSLSTDRLYIVKGVIPKLKIKLEHKFDIVFIDPPFQQNLLNPSLQWLQEQNVLAKNALIYIEYERGYQKLILPKTWQILKEKNSTNTTYKLISTKNN